jgi:hypothetical protein
LSIDLLQEKRTAHLYSKGMSVKNRQNLTGAQAVVATLRAYNVDTIFGIPGVHTLPLYDAMRQQQGLRHVLARHEQGAGFMADGYARISGRPGVVCTTPEIYFQKPIQRNAASSSFCTCQYKAREHTFYDELIVP